MRIITTTLACLALLCPAAQAQVIQNDHHRYTPRPCFERQGLVVDLYQYGTGCANSRMVMRRYLGRCSLDYGVFCPMRVGPWRSRWECYTGPGLRLGEFFVNCRSLRVDLRWVGFVIP